MNSKEASKMEKSLKKAVKSATENLNWFKNNSPKILSWLDKNVK